MVSAVDPQIQQRTKLILDRFQHPFVQISGLVAFRNVQEPAEIIDRHLPDAGLAELLETAIAFLRVRRPQGDELGQFETCELGTQIIEQEREFRIHLDRQSRVFGAGNEFGEQRELDDLVVLISEFEVQG